MLKYKEQLKRKEFLMGVGEKFKKIPFIFADSFNPYFVFKMETDNGFPMIDYIKEKTFPNKSLNEVATRWGLGHQMWYDIFVKRHKETGIKGKFKK